MVCDLTLASREHARFKQTDADVGSFDGGYGSAYLARQVGQKFAREVFFLGRPYAAEQMHRMGAVNEVVAHAELEQARIQWAAEINGEVAAGAADAEVRVQPDRRRPGRPATVRRRGDPAGVHDRRGRRGPRRVPREASAGLDPVPALFLTGRELPLDSEPVSKSPLRRLSDQIALAGMRPPIAPQMLVNRPAMKSIELGGKRILLTGASSGIGEAAAERFARLGATVVVVARRQDLLDAVADRITTAGGTATAIPCDISDMDAVDALVADVVERIGGVDILINNAGRSIRRPLAESLERWHDVERTMVLNYYAPLRLMRGLAPGMLERKDGHIINVTTWGVLSEASPLFSVYNASKAALSSVGRIAETEWGPKGVHSTTLFYPLVATPMIEPTKAYSGMPALTSEEAAEWMVTAARTRPVRIAPRIAIAARALDTIGPRWVNNVMQRRNAQS